jgi:hypothetical protein
MRRGQRKSPYRAAVAALQASIADRLKLNAADESLIADLLARDGDNAAAITAVITAVPPKRRRRRRRAVHTSRKPVNGRRKAVRARAIVAATPDAPEAVAAAPQPAPAARKVRGAEVHAAALAELDGIKAALDAAGDDAEKVRALSVRGDTILRQMAGKAKLPTWLGKATRMKWRRCAERAPAVKKPRKRRDPPAPPVRHDSGWRDEGGVLTREVTAR